MTNIIPFASPKPSRFDGLLDDLRDYAETEASHGADECAGDISEAAETLREFANALIEIRDFWDHLHPACREEEAIQLVARRALEKAGIVARKPSLSFEEWLEELKTTVIEGEFGYEPGEFSVFADGWFPLWEAGMSPSEAFQSELDKASL